MPDPCQLPVHNACCCTCQHHLQDFHHCCTTPEHTGCVCRQPKGWVCLAPEYPGVHSGWSAHGLCEMWEGPPVMVDELALMLSTVEGDH